MLAPPSPMAQILHLELLSSLPSSSPAYLEIRKPLLLTPAELTLLGLRKCPIVQFSQMVQLKCGYRSQLNDKRRKFNLPPYEPEQTLPWGKWEIEDAIIVLEAEDKTTRYLRYYDSLPDCRLKTEYFDADSGYYLPDLLTSDINRMMRRRNRRNTDVCHVVNLEHIFTLFTCKDGIVRDLDIIETQLD